MANASNKLKLLNALTEKRNYQIKGDFFEYCKEFSPVVKRTGRKIYRDDVDYFVQITHAMQALFEGTLKADNGIDIAKFLLISIPPRHGKSLTVSKFVEWLLGIDPTLRIISLSYSQDLADQFSKEIKSSIQRERDAELKVFSDVFPGIELSKDSKAAKKWKLKNSTHPYSFATGSFRTSGINGLGADVFILDDPHQGSEEAMNTKELNSKFNIYINTMLSRFEDGVGIVMHTRWSDDDMIGQISKTKVMSKKCKTISLKVATEQSDGSFKLLNEDLMTYDEYEMKKAEISDMIFNANYNQVIIDMDLALYKKYRFWEEFPEDEEYETVGVIDPSADGKDFTCSIIGRRYTNLKKFYITDVFYDDRPMTDIEPLLVEFIAKNNPEEVKFEANGAFSILANNVQVALRKKGCITEVDKFHQSKDKIKRIMVASNAMQEHVYFSHDMINNHKEAFNHFIKFKSDISSNEHDDFEDAMTLVWEKYIKTLDSEEIRVLNERFFI